MSATPDFGNYDPGRHVLSVLGQQIQGFASGTFIKVARKVPTFTWRAGGTGDIVRIRSRNKLGSFAFTLLATSPSNAYLSQLVLTDEQNDAGRGSVGPSELLSLPPNGITVCTIVFSCVSQPVDIEIMDSDVPGRQWMIEGGPLEMTTSGSTF